MVVEMKGKDKDRFIIVGDGQVLKSYRTFKAACWDLNFYQLMYHEVKIYQLVIQDNDPV